MPCLRTHTASNLPSAPPHVWGTIIFLLLLLLSLKYSPVHSSSPKTFPGKWLQVSHVALFSLIDPPRWHVLGYPPTKTGKWNPKLAGAKLKTPLCTPVTRFLLEASSLRAMLSLPSCLLHRDITPSAASIISLNAESLGTGRMPSRLRGGQCARPAEDSDPELPSAAEVVSICRNTMLPD